MDQPTTRRLKGVEDDRAVHLWFPGWVFCHVGHPKAVGFVTGEVAVDQVRGCVQGADPPCWGLGCRSGRQGRLFS